MADYYANQMMGRQGTQPTQISAPNVFGTAGSNAPNSPTISNSPTRAHTVANANFPEATVVQAAQAQPRQNETLYHLRPNEFQAHQFHSNSQTASNSQSGPTNTESNSRAGAHQFQATQPQATVHSR